MRKVNTVRFGEIEIEEDKVVHFAQGIPAFEEEHEFVIIPYDETSPYVFLQSLATPDLAFLLTIPFVFFPEYEFEIDDESLSRIGTRQQENLLIYVILTVPGGDVKAMTANLMAPLVINKVNMQAKQVVLDKSRYNTRHPLFQKTKEDA